jgi:hypothetical protein
LREHLLHLAAIRALQRERRYSLAAIRGYLAPLGTAELERLAATVLPELAAPTSPASLASAASPASFTSLPSPGSSASDLWHRHTLAPGLEIHVHAAANNELRALAHYLAASARSALSFASPRSPFEPPSAPPAAVQP